MEGKHPVSILQELMAQKYKQLPEYRTSDISTRLCPRFECRVRVVGIEGVGISSSKQCAKRLAAEDALKQLEHSTLVVPVSSNSNTHLAQINYNAIGILNEFTAKKKLPYPAYDECGVNSSNEFIIRCTVMSYAAEGNAATKKVAKQVAAHNMLKYLENNNLLHVPISSTIVGTKTVSDDTVFDKFRQLSVKSIKKVNTEVASVKSESDTESDVKSESNIESDESLEKVTLYNVEEITSELDQLNISYTVNVFGKNPWVLLFKLENGENTTVVESGNTYEEAYSKLLNSAVKVIRTLNMAKE